jgi:acetyl-CoA C-acetyltransferase
MPTTGVWIAGSFQTDFARKLDREHAELSDLMREVIVGTLADASLESTAVETVHVGNAFAELFNGQAQLGALPAAVVPGLTGLPATRHEAACASGSVAIISAMADLEAGRYDCALVVGIEQERNVPSAQAAANMGTAVWAGHEGQDAKLMWPEMFAAIADEYDRRYGLDTAHLHALAAQAVANAQANPLAQTRSWSYTPASFSDDETANPQVSGLLRRTDCSPISDGAVGLVLVSDRFARRHPSPAFARIAGWGHATGPLGLADQLTLTATSELIFPHVRAAFDAALARASLSSVYDTDGIELHDCFSISAYLSLDHVGITPPGRAFVAVEDGRIARDGTIPVNPTGGLLGIGHPVGATGTRMVHDARLQVLGLAGACQVQGARTFATLNLGGTLATAVSFVVTAT